jgi:hypothetical protein
MSSLRTRAGNSNFAFAVLRKEVFAVRVFSFFRCHVDCLRLPLRLPLFFRRSLVKNQFLRTRARLQQFLRDKIELVE